MSNSNLWAIKCFQFSCQYHSFSAEVFIVLVSVTSSLVDDLGHIQHTTTSKRFVLCWCLHHRVCLLTWIKDTHMCVWAERLLKMCVCAGMSGSISPHTVFLALVSCMMQRVQRSVRFQLNHCIMTVCVCVCVLKCCKLQARDALHATTEAEQSTGRCSSCRSLSPMPYTLIPAKCTSLSLTNTLY